MTGPDIIYGHFPGLTGEQKRQMELLYPLYREWNEKINVISRKDCDMLYLHHVLHSLAIAKYMEENSICACSIIDTGCGGGFPGIPLAILFPHIRFTLCDSIAKKIKVAAGIAKSINAVNVETVCCRAESLHSRYDYAVSRAVTSLKKLIPMTGHLYEKGMICLKGGSVADEIRECTSTLGIPAETFTTVKISKWFEEEFFSEKFVIFAKSTTFALP